MNIWTANSIELANQRNYLDLLYQVYPMGINLRREIDEDTQRRISEYFNERDEGELLNILLDQDLFPVKDSYVAYLRHDKTSIERNPRTVDRISSILFEMGLDNIIFKATEPKETNRQIGPLFKNWIEKGSLTKNYTRDVDEFLNFDGDIVFSGSDKAMEDLARDYFGYTHEKGLDFIAKFNNKVVLAEAKFLTDFGGHQNAQFNDAISVIEANLEPTEYDVVKIAILDGVLYIDNNAKMHKYLKKSENENQIIISSLLLRDYLYSL